MKTSKLLSVLFLVSCLATACKKDSTEDDPKPKPTATNLEIGINNEKKAYAGRDFHFNATVLAGEKIALVEIKILQRPSENYSKTWKYEINWDQYKDLKNTTVHKHFTIPEDAPKGVYDFLFIVTDQNGTRLEMKETLLILAKDEFSIRPFITIKGISENQVFRKNESINATVEISNDEGSGMYYALLIKQKLNYHPEEVSKTDFEKAVVLVSGATKDMNLHTVHRFTTSITIGAEKDNTSWGALPINGLKEWESGIYYLYVVYTNFQYNISITQKIPLTINLN